MVMLKPGKFTLTTEHLQRALDAHEMGGGAKTYACLVAQGLRDYFGSDDVKCGFNAGFVDGKPFDMLGAEKLVHNFDYLMIVREPAGQERMLDAIKRALPAEIEVTYVQE